jgi:hypothetical protein
MNKTATHCSRAAWAAPTVSAEHEAQALSRVELDERHQCVVEVWSCRREVVSLTRRRASRAWPGAASRSLILAGSEHD